MELIIDEDQISRALAKRRKARSGAIEESSSPVETTLDDPAIPARHYLTEEISHLLTLRLNLWLVGPAGSGKSKCAEQCAESLSLPYSAPPIGRETPISQLFGYFNAAGNYVRTPIRERAEHGGILHLEEIDFASPAVGTALNALLANDYIGFPDKVIKKHPDFIVIASANTYGSGATAQYIGSQGLNAATLDRFVFLDFPYDEKMEARISPNKAWAAHVQAIRARAASLNVQRIFSPRASIMGGRMINSKKFTWERTETLLLFKNLDPITIAKLKGEIN